MQALGKLFDWLDVAKARFAAAFPISLSLGYVCHMRTRATLQDARFEQVDPRRRIELHDLETFDRIAFAMRALDVLRPKRLRVALYRTTSQMQVEVVKDVSREGYRVASVGIPDDASAAHIAYALAEIAGVTSVPYAVQMMLAVDRRKGA